MPEAAVGIFVDYGSPLARRAAEELWAGLSRAALDAGRTGVTASWETLSGSAGLVAGPGDLPLCVFVVGQDRPDAVDDVRAVGNPSDARIYGVVVAVPDPQSPLAGSLLYAGVRRLTEGGVRPGSVLPALLPARRSAEGGAYARRLVSGLVRS